MNIQAAVLYKLGEYLGAGMFENESATIVERYALGIRRYFENVTPPQETGLLYPAPEDSIWSLGGKYIRYHYSNSLDVDGNGLYEYGKKVLGEGFELDVLEGVIAELKFFGTCCIAPKHWVGGNGWTHTVLNYPRILREGLQSYTDRVGKMSPSPLKTALQDTLAGITSFLKRAPGNIAAEVMTPAKDFHHAIRSFNFIFALDNYDSAGRFDEYMGDYYKGEADAAEYLQELFRAVDRHDGWHLLYTGKNPDFTKLCIGVQQTSRPNSGLLITKDTPVEIWDAVFAKWAEGIPCPCLYNAEEYIKSLQYYGPEIAEAAENLLSFGGCTETMFQGCSNIGSTEAGINLLKILTCSTADNFYENIKKEIELTIKEIRINCEFAAEFRPHLIRTLFVDDCIERELEYHNGGAIYNGSIFNVAGLTNAANALAAMQGNNEKFGNDQDIADGIARDLAAYTFGLIRQYRSRLDGITLPAIIILSHFTALGRTIDVTADGRNAGDPVVDSAGAVPGTDIYGPTALLKSVAKLPGSAAAGTPVLNIRLQKNILQNSGSELRSLFMSFFQMGGMQLQATVADQETLRAAHENPADYPDLMIRIGGFSTYFASLDKNLREDILKRTEHAL